MTLPGDQGSAQGVPTLSSEPPLLWHLAELRTAQPGHSQVAAIPSSVTELSLCH